MELQPQQPEMASDKAKKKKNNKGSNPHQRRSSGKAKWRKGEDGAYKKCYHCHKDVPKGKMENHLSRCKNKGKLPVPEPEQEED